MEAVRHPPAVAVRRRRVERLPGRRGDARRPLHHRQPAERVAGRQRQRQRVRRRRAEPVGDARPVADVADGVAVLRLAARQRHAAHEAAAGRQREVGRERRAGVLEEEGRPADGGGVGQQRRSRTQAGDVDPRRDPEAEVQHEESKLAGETGERRACHGAAAGAPLPGGGRGRHPGCGHDPGEVRGSDDARAVGGQ